MKKYLLAAAIIASLNLKAQETKPTGRATDLLQNQKIDSSDIPIISIKDLEQTLAELGDKVSHNTYVIIQQAYQQAVTDAIKRKQSKPKK